MASIILKNVSGVDLPLDDFGITLIVGEERTLSDTFDFADIVESDELKQYISDGDIVINNGTSDLSIADSLAAVTLESKYEDEENDPSGGSGWSVGTTPPGSPSNGDGWFNVNTQMLYFWDALRTAWLTARWNTHYALPQNARNKYLYPSAYHDDPEGHVYLLRPVTVCAAHVSVEVVRRNTDAGIALEEDYVNKGDLIIDGSTQGWKTYAFPTLTVNFSAGSRMQMYCWSNKRIDEPFVTLECAWRYVP
jgi:hypothetical protein